MKYLLFFFIVVVYAALVCITMLPMLLWSLNPTKSWEFARDVMEKLRIRQSAKWLVDKLNLELEE
jgi:hypothetical protein